MLSARYSRNTKILIIGANGLLGRIISEHLSASIDHLFGIDCEEEGLPSARFQLEDKADSQLLKKPFPGKYHIADITQEDDLRKTMRDCGQIDVVIMLAAALENQTPETIQAVNVDGVNNVYKICTEQNIKRVILASSMMVLWDKYSNEEPYRSIKNQTYQQRYQNFKPITESDALYESTLGETASIAAYKNSKINGEALAQHYTIERITTICMRVGSVNTKNQPPAEHAWAWTSYKDLCQFIDRSIHYLCSSMANRGHSLPLFLCSDNKLCIVSLKKAREVLNYVPHDGTNKIARQVVLFTPAMQEDEEEYLEPPRLTAKL